MQRHFLKQLTERFREVELLIYFVIGPRQVGITTGILLVIISQDNCADLIENPAAFFERLLS